MIVLDTTVLVYAKGEEHSLREPCRGLLAAIADGRVDATTSVEVLQEFAHVYSRRRTESEAASRALEAAEILAPLLPVTIDHLRHGLSLFEAYEGLGAFDAVLAAAAIDSGASALVSADRAFGGVDGLTHLAPDERGVAALVGPE